MAIIDPALEVIHRQKVQPTEGEWALINFLLSNLDDTYEIYYQPYLNGDNPDIVVMRKGSGVLIIEVKDWNLDSYYIDSSRKWRLHKNDAHIKSPLQQVENYKDNLFTLHIEELFKKSIKSKNHWATVNCALYFHNATQQQLEKFLLDNFQEEQHQGYRKFVGYFGLLGSDSLNRAKLNSVLTKFWLNKQSYYFDEELYKSFRRYLKAPVHQIEDGLEIIYTKEQQELIRSEIRPRRKIKGVAGSGKTLVLAKRAVNAHIRTGSRVLILTFNLSLKNYIHDRINDVREEFYWSNFYITNYHQFFKAQANNYNLPIHSLSDFENTGFFSTKKEQIEKFDVVLIDEIQDYMQNWVDIITTYFTHSETEFAVFGDEKQNIYDRELDENSEPIVRTVAGTWNKSLNMSHRFGSSIANIAIKFQNEFFGKKYRADELKVMSQFDFEKRIIKYQYYDTYSIEGLYNSIYKVLNDHEIHSSDTGILCSKVEILRGIDLAIRTQKKEKTSTTFESQEEYEQFGDNHEKIEQIRRLKKNHFWMKTGTVKLSTVHSFKGWEINTLFLFIESEDDESEFTIAELIYTGLTRARNNLIIFNLGNDKYDKFFKTEIEILK
jgi:AAA domain/Nuclease-related domain/UvrD-like helicase C-terminal domain